MATQKRCGGKSEPYDGLLGKTRRGATIFSCSCGARFGTNIFLSVNAAEEPDLAERAVSGKLNWVKCPACGTESEIAVKYIFHVPTSRLFVLVLPPACRHLEIQARAELYKEIAEAPSELVPDYVVNFACVFGSEGLRDLLANPQAYAAETIWSEKLEFVARLEEELKQREASLLKKEEAIAQKEEALARKEEAFARREEAIARREEKIKRRGEEVTQMEDLLRERAEELEQSAERLNAFAAHLKEWEAQLSEREQQYQERSGRLLEEKKKGKDEAARHPVAPQEIPELTVREEAPWWFRNQVDADASPSLSSSIEQILSYNTKVQEVSDNDIIEETNLVNEGDVIEERPIVAIPLKETPPPWRVTDRQRKWVQNEAVRKDLMSSRKRSALVHGDRVQLWAVTDEKTLLENPEPAWMRLRCHLVRDRGGFPWIVLTLTVRPPKGEPRLFRWLFNFKDPEHYRIVRYLEKKLEVEMNFVSPDMEKGTHLTVTSPLSLNFKRIVDKVEMEIESHQFLQPERDLDEEALIGSLLAEMRKPFPFSAAYFTEHASPKQTLDAVEEVNRWLSPELADTLFEVYSFPMEVWDQIKLRVAKAALQWGLFLPDPLWKEALSAGLVRGKREVLERQIKSFATLCLEGEGLSAEEKRENWEKLLGEARNISLDIDPWDARVALNFVEESALDEKVLLEVKRSLEVDLPTADQKTLVSLLMVKSKRAEAMEELLRRGEKGVAEALLKAMVELSGEELTRVLPTLAAAEETGEMLLLQGLRSQRREIRMACAAYLGKKRLRSAIIPLMKLMFESQEPDWKFVAWLITGYGPSGLRAVEQFLGDPLEQEEKMIYILAAFLSSGQAKQIDKISAGANFIVKSIVNKAVERAGQIGRDEEAIRKLVAWQIGIPLPQ